MQYIDGCVRDELPMLSEIRNKAGSVIKIKGTVHKIREMSGFAFVVLRSGRDLIQCLYSGQWSRFDLEAIAEGYALAVTGAMVLEERAVGGFEIQMHDVEILSKPAREMPVVINQRKLNLSLDTNLALRPLSLRNPRVRAVFKIQEGLVRGFRGYLTEHQFTELCCKAPLL